MTKLAGMGGLSTMNALLRDGIESITLAWSERRLLFRKWICVLGLVLFAGVHSLEAAPLSELVAVERVRIWMKAHPVMGAVADHDIESVSTFPEEEAINRVFIVSLKPCGYVVLNSDDTLPLVVAFSPNSIVDLSDRPDNAFRAALMAQAATMAQILSKPQAAPADFPARLISAQSEDTDQIYGPYLETSWNQCHPYNLNAPLDTDNPSAYYGGRVPAGCTPTAYASVLNYHRWPVYGEGTYSYTDSVGSITGFHSVDFSIPFAWNEMRSSYNPWETSQPGDAAVSDLFYRLGVAAGANYESSGTCAGVPTLSRSVTQYLYYEEIKYHSSQDALLPALDADLMAGFPSAVAIPGHTIVADGLMITGADKSYHIDYGWGGRNSGWWTADNVAGVPLTSGATSIRPALMAFPVSRSVQAFESSTFEMNWILPMRRESEARSLLIFEHQQQAGLWTNDASSFDHATPEGWTIRRGEGRDSGDCWYAGPSGYAALTLEDVFVPTAETQLQFSLQYRLGSAAITLSVSDDGGESYTELFRRSSNFSLSWQTCSVNLGAYAGSRVLLRFELHNGSGYLDSGVWVDNLSLTNATWYRWMSFAEDNVLASRLFPETNEQPIHYTELSGITAGSYVLASAIEDYEGNVHRKSPSVVLEIKTAEGDAAMPSFSPRGGALVGVGNSINVTLTCLTDGATICYTTDGSEPMESSPMGMSGTVVSLPVPGTLRARAFRDGLNPSGVTSSSYTAAPYVAAPTFSPDGGEHAGAIVEVLVSCATTGATIRYTTNGTEPTESSLSVAPGGTVGVPLPGTLKAKAFKSGMNPSATKLASYTAAVGGWDLSFQDLGGGWRRLAWFWDYIPMGGEGWIWHSKHGFLFVPPSAVPESIWMYSQDMGWVWTGNTVYPFLYRLNDGAWLWYNGSTSPRWFINMNTSRWEQWP